jgi:adenylate kinase family enzyme
MKKIYIVGIVASGKTTFAKKLSMDLDIPWLELDSIVKYDDSEYKGYNQMPEQQVEIISEIDKKGKWIIEGTYRQSCHFLFDMADTIIFLDPPLWKRKIRIFTRFVKQIIGLEKSHYKPNLKILISMYKWTNKFEKSKRDFIKILSQYRKKLIIVSDEAELDQIGK